MGTETYKTQKRNDDTRTILEWLIAHYDKNSSGDEFYIYDQPNSHQICLATGIPLDDVFNILDDLSGLGTVSLHDTKPEDVGLEVGPLDTFSFFHLNKPDGARAVLEAMRQQPDLTPSERPRQ